MEKILYLCTNNIKQATQMVYTFRIVSDEIEDFRREIQIDASATFLELRNAICDEVKYDRGEMSSFFICDDNWEREREITLEDMSHDSTQEVYLMDETPIDEFIEDEGQRLTWVFDYLTERCLFLEMKKLETGKTLKSPFCTLRRGEAPQQHVDLEAFEKELDAKAAAEAAKIEKDPEIDEEFYGSDSYNEDEFDAEGYDELTY